MTACIGVNNGNGTVNAGVTSQSTLTTSSPTPTPVATSGPTPTPGQQALSLQINATQVSTNAQVQYSAIGGKPPYRFQLISASGGSLDDSTGTLRVPSHSSIVELQVTDNSGAVDSKEIKVTVPGVQPNDTYFGSMVHLGPGGINADQGWSVRTDCRSIPVAVVDTGVDLTHPDIAANIYTNPGEIAGNAKDDDGDGYVNDIHGWNFVPRLSIVNHNFVDNPAIKGNNDPTDDGYHGTHVAGAIGALGNNGDYVTGVCWRATIIPVKALMKVPLADSQTGAFAYYDFEAPTSEIVAGVTWAADRGAKVINLSIGGEDDGTGNLYQTAFAYAAAKGALVVVAAGNSGENMDQTAFLPGGLSSPNQITVGATDPGNDNALASFSNYSASKVQIAAPGKNNLSLFPHIQNDAMKVDKIPAGYGPLSGTSMATPLVSGALALFWSKYPSLTPSQVRSEFLKRARSLDLLAGNVEDSRFLDMGELMYDR